MARSVVSRRPTNSSVGGEPRRSGAALTPALVTCRGARRGAHLPHRRDLPGPQVRDERVRPLARRQERGGHPAAPSSRQPTTRGRARLGCTGPCQPNVSGSGYNPWQDVLDRRQGRIFYWGDAKADERRLRDDFEGNRYLGAVWRAVNEHRWQEVPPILHFSKDEKGTVRFNGLCVLVDLQDAWFEDGGRSVRNYHAPEPLAVSTWQLHRPIACRPIWCTRCVQLC